MPWLSHISDIYILLLVAILVYSCEAHTENFLIVIQHIQEPVFFLFAEWNSITKVEFKWQFSTSSLKL